MRNTYDFAVGLAVFFSVVIAANASFQLMPTSASYLSTDQWKEATVIVPSSDKTLYLNTPLSLKLSNVPLQVALDIIAAKTDVRFSYSEEIVPVERRISVNIENAPLAEALDKTLSNTDLAWIPQENNQVVITERSLVQQGKGSVKGRVVDQNGSPVAFANILVLGTTMGASADANGYYLIENIPAGTHTLRSWISAR
ncbi:MAG: carboxypeptidase-like regulatory domain-containing protein [Candidatus Kryptoniota bacterium]